MTTGRKGYDPAQLLRRSWEGDVDALAQELYVLFSTGVKPPAPNPARSSLVGFGNLEDRSRFRARQAGSARALVAPERNPIVAPPPPSRSPVSTATPEPRPVAPPALPAAPAQAVPSVAVSAATPVALPSAPVPSSSPEFRAVSPLGARMRMTFDGGGAGPLPPPSSPPPSAPDVAPLAAPVPRRAESAPIEAPALRSISPLGASTRLSAGAEISPTAFEPGFFRNPVVLATSGVGVSPAISAPAPGFDLPMQLARATEAYRRPTADHPARSPKPRDFPDLGFDQKALGYITAPGVTAVDTSEATGNVLGKPGKGQFYLVEFDGDALSYGDDRDPVDCYNLSIFPISGSLFWAMERIGEYFFCSHRPSLVHAIVTQQIGPCAGTTPGKGKAQVYYRSKGDLTAGPTIDVENWYNVTGPVGRHCGLVEADGMAALEVLDCPTA